MLSNYIVHVSDHRFYVLVLKLIYLINLLREGRGYLELVNKFRRLDERQCLFEFGQLRGIHSLLTDNDELVLVEPNCRFRGIHVQRLLEIGLRNEGYVKTI